MSDMMQAPHMEETADAATTAEATDGNMKAVSQELGSPDVLRLVSLPTPEPGVSQILIRVHAAGVNPIDGLNRQTGAFVGNPPFVLGWDVSGTVAAVGLGVTLFKPGDEVFGMLPFPRVTGRTPTMSPVRPASSSPSRVGLTIVRPRRFRW